MPNTNRYHVAVLRIDSVFYEPCPDGSRVFLEGSGAAWKGRESFQILRQGCTVTMPTPTDATLVRLVTARHALYSDGWVKRCDRADVPTPLACAVCATTTATRPQSKLSRRRPRASRWSSTAWHKRDFVRVFMPQSGLLRCAGTKDGSHVA